MTMAQPIDTTRLVFQALMPPKEDEIHPILGPISSLRTPDASCSLCGWEGSSLLLTQNNGEIACPNCFDSSGLDEPEYVIEDGVLYREESTLITELQVGVTKNKTHIFSLPKLLDVRPSQVKVDRLLVRGSGTIALAPKAMLRYTPPSGFIGVDKTILSCFQENLTNEKEVRVLCIRFLVSANTPL